MLKELWEYKELFYFLAWREMKLRYRQTLLGVLWAIIQPLFTMILFTVVFGGVVKAPTDGAPYPVFYYSALLPWMYFSTTITMSGTSLVTNAPLITKVYFPRVILPLAPAISGLVDFAIGFTGLAALLIIYRVPPTWKLLFWPVPILLLIMLASAIGTFLSALNVKYRDVKYAVPFLLQLWLFATPIVYPARLLKGTLKWVLTLNPLTGIIGAFRAACVTGGVIDWPALGISAAAIAIISVVAALYFRKVEDTMSDVI
jgi:lipopolysaccharide transport system permease protein